MTRDLLSAEVSTAEACGDSESAPPLFGGKTRLLERAVDERRREFRTVRACAREAMRQLGWGPAPILRGTRGEPLWPEGLVGSMAHCPGYRVAAVARAEAVATIGIDAEPNEPLPDVDMTLLIANAEEGALLSALAVRHLDIAWARLLFSAMKSVYKAWYPLTGRWLDFHDAMVTTAGSGRSATDCC